MKVLILDDETSARETLKAYLGRMTSHDFQIKEASSISEALELYSHFKPEIALLDINLREGTSFDFLSMIGLEQIEFKVIFITAFDDYAIKAFKFNAVDYILKPVNPIEFEQAMGKAINDHRPGTPELQLKNLAQDLSENTHRPHKLVLKDQHQIHLVALEDIIYCSSESNYTSFHLLDGSRILISQTLKAYETLLKGKQFFRTHRSHLINLDHLKRFDKREGGIIEMNGGHSVPLARDRKEIFMKILEAISSSRA